MTSNFSWDIEDATASFNTISRNTPSATDYEGMAMIEMEAPTTYKVRITIRYYFKFQNAIVKVESITIAQLTTDCIHPLFSVNVDDESVSALYILLYMILNGLRDEIEKEPDLIKNYIHPSDAKIKQKAIDLLNSRSELEN